MAKSVQRVGPSQYRSLLERYCADLVNNERTRVMGAEARLSWNQWAALAARRHSRDMLIRGYFDHISPEGRDVGDRLSGAGFRFLLAGENIAKQWGTGSDLPAADEIVAIHNGLMESTGHRHNILEASFHLVGVGITYVHGALVLTQVFLTVATNPDARGPPA